MRLAAALAATFVLVAGSFAASARPASGYSGLQPDPWMWCFNNQPFFEQRAWDGWQLFWRGSGLGENGSGAAWCTWWVWTGSGWVWPYSQAIDWSAACAQQFPGTSTLPAT